MPDNCGDDILETGFRWQREEERAKEALVGIHTWDDKITEMVDGQDVTFLSSRKQGVGERDGQCRLMTEQR